MSRFIWRIVYKASIQKSCATVVVCPWFSGGKIAVLLFLLPLVEQTQLLQIAQLTTLRYFDTKLALKYGFHNNWQRYRKSLIYKLIIQRNSINSKCFYSSLSASVFNSALQHIITQKHDAG